MKSILLLSGGLDSTSLSALLRPDHCLIIDYGQLAAQAEVRAAQQVSIELGLSSTVVRVPAQQIGAGLMSGEQNDRPREWGTAPEWWPFRNQLLVTLAAAWGVTRGYGKILLGTVASDGMRHADGTNEFRTALDELLLLQEGNMRLEAPAANMTSVELIRASGVTEKVLAWTHSCHRANLPCNQCPGCFKRAQVLEEAQLLR